MWIPRPEMVLYEKGDWRVRQERKGEPAFYGCWPGWNVGRSPVVIQHKHDEKWETASGWVMDVTLEWQDYQYGRRPDFFALDNLEQVGVWGKDGRWRKDCRVCQTPFPEEVIAVFDFFRELMYD